MSEALRFKDFTVGADSVLDLGAVPQGAGEPQRPGVISEIKNAFGYEGDDLGGLIGHIAPHKNLQENIAFAREILNDPSVREKINYGDKNGIEVARAWGKRSGLQEEVFRPLMQPAGEIPKEFTAIVVTDAVYNWVNRMSGVAYRVGRVANIDTALLAASGRVTKPDETDEIAEGTPIKDYMEGTLKPRLEKPFINEGSTEERQAFDTVEVVTTESESGADVMAEAVEYLLENDIDLNDARLIIASVAGNWMQKGSQLRAAIKGVHADFDEDPADRQLWVASDSFPLGITGEEPKTTHQNPFSAIGNILRGAKLLDEQS